MKHKIKAFLVLLLGASLLFACGQGKSNEKTANTAEKTSDKSRVVVTTSFLSDMVKNLAGDKVDVDMIIPAGEDPHLYEAKPQDLEKIKQADLLIYHGLHFEGKMVDVLESKGKAVTADFKEDEIGEMDEDGDTVVDPHFWFDIDLYKKATQACAKYLEELLPNDTETIEKNAESYLAKLDELDQENREALNSIPKDQRYLITPHDAFNYFSRRYDMPVKAPQGVSTDSEVANKDVDDTVNFIVEHKIKAIFAESTTAPARMQKLQEACQAKGHSVEVVHGDGKELFSDSLAPQGEAGDTYLDMYRHNVKLMTEYLK